MTSAATTSIGRSPAAARSAALRRSHSSAAGDRSTATTRPPAAPGRPRGRSPRSRCTGRTTSGAAGAPRASSIPQPASSSVSGRGHEDARARPPAPGAGSRRRRSGAAAAPAPPAGHQRPETGRAAPRSGRGARPAGPRHAEHVRGQQLGLDAGRVDARRGEPDAAAARTRAVTGAGHAAAVSGGSARSRRPAGRPGRPRSARRARRPGRRRAPGRGCTRCSRSGGR